MALLNVLKQAYADTDSPPDWKTGGPITVKLKRALTVGPLTVSRIVVFPPTLKELQYIGADLLAMREVEGGLIDLVVDRGAMMRALTTLLRWPENIIEKLPVDELPAITSAVRSQLLWALDTYVRKKLKERS